MKECPSCGACYEDHIEHCRLDGSELKSSADAGVGQIGTVILDDKYLLETRLGKGGMGTVYKATQLILQRNVAIKILNLSLTADHNAKERFHREALAIAKLKHPNIVSVYDFGFSIEGYAYLVMEFISGFTLKHLLARWPKCGLEFGIDIGRQICEAIAVAHTHGVLHRDLKPENIMFEGLFNTSLVKVVDFGLAKLLTDRFQEAKLTDPHIILGTSNYMSPEQCRGDETDHRSDIYSLGVLFYEMFTGNPPFVGASPLQVMALHMTETPVPPSQIVADMPAQLEDMILVALAKDPDERQQSAEEMAHELAELLITMSSYDIKRPNPITTTAGLLKARRQMRSNIERQQLIREIEQYKVALEQAPKDTTLQQKLAELYQQVGQIEEAITSFIAAGDLLRETGKLEQAVLAYSKVRNVVNLRRRTAIANKLASVYYKMNQHRQAYQQCRQVLLYYLGKNRIEEAVKYLQTVPTLSEADINYHTQLEELIKAHTSMVNNGRHSWLDRLTGYLSNDLSDQSVLIADPDPIVCSQLAHSLSELGCQIQLADTGQQVLEIVERQRPTLIISELALPDMSGSVLFKKLVNSSLTQELIFICLSTIHSDVEIDAAFAQGIDEYWGKPFDVEAVKAKVKRLLLRSKRRRKLSGHIGESSVMEILQQLEQAGRTGCLTLRTDDDHIADAARIFLVDGVIVNVELGILPLLGALYRILTWDSGEFLFREDPPCEDQPLRLTRRQLIFEMLKFFDEEQKIILQLPPAATHLKLEWPKSFTESCEQGEKVPELFDGSRSINECLEQLRGDLDAFDLVLALYRSKKERNLTLHFSKAEAQRVDTSALTRRFDE
ncbi:MAG: protein kinase [Acidobacteriota bacterium]